MWCLFWSHHVDQVEVGKSMCVMAMSQWSYFMWDERFSFKTEIGVEYWKFQRISEYLLWKRIIKRTISRTWNLKPYSESAWNSRKKQIHEDHISLLFRKNPKKCDICKILNFLHNIFNFEDIFLKIAPKFYEISPLKIIKLRG